MLINKKTVKIIRRQIKEKEISIRLDTVLSEYKPERKVIRKGNIINRKT